MFKSTISTIHDSTRASRMVITILSGLAGPLRDCCWHQDYWASVLQCWFGALSLSHGSADTVRQKMSLHAQLLKLDKGSQSF